MNNVRQGDVYFTASVALYSTWHWVGGTVMLLAFLISIKTNMKGE